MLCCQIKGVRIGGLGLGLGLEQLELQSQPMIHIIRKGRRERFLPLWEETVTAISCWLAIRPDNKQEPKLFLNAQGTGMTRSGFEYILSKHVKAASSKQPSLLKKRVTPHSLRHSCAMATLKATHDISKVSLWLGHAALKSTEIYLRAEPDEKLETLMATVPLSLRRGKFRAPDKLLAMLGTKK